MPERRQFLAIGHEFGAFAQFGAIDPENLVVGACHGKVRVRSVDWSQVVAAPFLADYPSELAARWRLAQKIGGALIRGSSVDCIVPCTKSGRVSNSLGWAGRDRWGRGLICNGSFAACRTH
jgi:hypothetical protein